MTTKRKRDQLSNGNTEGPRKQVKTDPPHTCSVRHPTLCLYYRNISTLRDYLLSKLPAKSKARHRRIASVGREDSIGQASKRNPALSGEQADTQLEPEVYLAKFLDTTLVCTVDSQAPILDALRAKEFEIFSQQVSLTAGSSNNAGGTSSQFELIDFAIWLLFHKRHRRTHRPPHMLCHGYQRASTPRHFNKDHCAVAGIPGIISHFPNTNVSNLKDANWAMILSLLGKEGDRIMLDLVLDCGIFVAVTEGRGNFYQLSGEKAPLSPVVKLTHTT